MNQREAKLLVRVGKTDVFEILNHGDTLCNVSPIGRHRLVQNWEHLEAFAELGEYQYKVPDGQWSLGDNLSFSCSGCSYRAVPKKEINWEKALENGAYGKMFHFRNNEEMFSVCCTLRGYRPGEIYPFVTTCSVYKYCDIPLSFVVPEEWYD